MSASTPASANAFVSNGRSAPSQRADEAVSGRITPTLAFLAAGVDVPDDEPEFEFEFESSLPHAATVNAMAAVTAHATRARCFMLVLPFLRFARRWRLSANSNYPRPNDQVSSARRARAPSQHQGNRPEHLRAVAERALQHLYVVGRGADRTAPQRLAQRVEQQIAGGAQVPADDHLLRVEEVAQRGHGGADRAAGIGDRPRAAGI